VQTLYWRQSDTLKHHRLPLINLYFAISISQVTDTPNDTAFKVTMVLVVCGLIRNCNQSRDTTCLDVKGESRVMLPFS
jgi:hypothetical protein